jgi:hypothetical protein
MECLMSRWPIAWPSDQQLEAIFESGHDRWQRQMPQARGGEFDRQWQTIQGSANGDHVRRVFMRQRE